MWPFKKTAKMKTPVPASLFGIYEKPVEYERAEVYPTVLYENEDNFAIKCLILPRSLRPNVKDGETFKMIVMVEKEQQRENLQGQDKSLQQGL